MKVLESAAMNAGLPGLHERIAAVDWRRVETDLDAHGHAVVPQAFTPSECEEVASLYSTAQDGRFRSRVVMQQHGFGRGEYQYFSYPLPRLIGHARDLFYERLAPIANRWNEALGIDTRFPPRHAEFLERCHAAGQSRPTPLLLKYGAGDYNCLHQDLYGEHVFALQVVVLLSVPGRDFEGGEFVMTEQRPRRQSRAMVVPLHQGDAAVIAVRHRPVVGTRGVYRVNVRHGVSRVRVGNRFTAGIVFHDAA